MFLPFIKKNATELDLILKIQSKYKDLSLSTVLGLVNIHNQFGSDGLNKNIEVFLKDYPTVIKASNAYVREVVPHGIQLDCNLEEIAPYSHLIYIRDELFKKFDANDLIHFAFVIKQNESDVFKTVISDIVNTDKNPDISVINTIYGREVIFSDISKYLKLSSDVWTEELEFWDTQSMKTAVINAVINDPNQVKTHHFKYLSEAPAKPVVMPVDPAAPYLDPMETGTEESADSVTEENIITAAERLKPSQPARKSNRDVDTVAKANGKPTTYSPSVEGITSSGKIPPELPTPTRARVDEGPSKYPQDGHPYWVDNDGVKHEGRPVEIPKTKKKDK